MATPNAVDVYSRFMDALFDEKEVINVSTVWQNFFGKPGNGGSKTIYSPDSEVVDIDIMRGNERTAKMILRDSNSRNLNIQQNTVTQNFSTFSRRYPLAEELGDITASQINKRLAGENPYEAVAKIDRMRSLAREHHLEHIRRYVRLFEVLAGASLLGGQQPALLGSTNADNWYDFRRNAAHIVSPAVPWDDPAANILGDIDAACRLLRVNGKVKPNVMFLGQNLFPVFLADTTVKDMADNRRFELIMIGTGNNTMVSAPPALAPLMEGGAIFRGILRTPEGFELYIFTYIDVVTDDAGDPQNLMPLNSCFLGYYGARCDRYFGPSEVLPLVPSDMIWYQEMFGFSPVAIPMPTNIRSGAIVTPQMFYCDAYPSDRKKVTIRTQTAPIFATTQTDAFFTYYDCLTRSS